MPSPLASPTLDRPGLPDGPGLLAAYQTIRRCTEELCRSLDTEDYVVQSMPDASPVKWHLAHTSWFFETFVLAPFRSGYRAYHPAFGVLFNSYYNAVGPRWARPDRGILSRPAVAEIYRYRAYVDHHMGELLRSAAYPGQRLATTELGLHHEQQHQELILTDVKHAFALNPLRPLYREALPGGGEPPPLQWLEFPEGTAFLGNPGDGFGFDNEGPRHRVYLQPFRLASRLVTCGEYLEFMSDGGYERPDLWLSDGWTACRTGEWRAPLYWETQGCQWGMMTLTGFRPMSATEPICHVSYYEADAYARWAGARLPTEAEWETAAATVPLAGHFLEGQAFHPSAAPAEDDRGPLFQLFGDVWQWTSSPHTAYPGYQPPAGALGEYNGKFMCNQMVLRGASCVTPRSHDRRTYRNFFPSHVRWQFCGIRLAQDGPG